MKPLFSVIVPVYKTEKYLHRCVDSVLEQTFENWEMRPLHSTVEQYGMALALVATIREISPVWENGEFFIRYGSNFSNQGKHVVILFKAPPKPKAKISKVLKDW